MPYDPKLQANLVVDRPYHSMMKAIAHSKGQTLRRGLELIIEAEYKRNDVELKKPLATSDTANPPSGAGVSK